MQIDHIGYAVQDLSVAVKSFSTLGYEILGEETLDDKRKVRILFMQDPKGTKVELIAPAGEDSPVTAWLQKNGNSPYHLCYETENFDGRITDLKNEGFLVVHPPLSAPALGERRVAFLYSRATGLIELLESRPAEDRSLSGKVSA